jgi:hypothetical protein
VPLPSTPKNVQGELSEKTGGRDGSNLVVHSYHIERFRASSSLF